MLIRKTGEEVDIQGIDLMVGVGRLKQGNGGKYVYVHEKVIKCCLSLLLTADFSACRSHD